MITGRGCAGNPGMYGKPGDVRETRGWMRNSGVKETGNAMEVGKGGAGSETSKLANYDPEKTQS